jgi:hypothetical protein
VEVKVIPHIKSLPTAATNRAKLLISSKFLNVILFFANLAYTFQHSEYEK